MTSPTSSEDQLDRGVTLRVDLTGVLACLFVAILITCAVVGFGRKSPVDDVAQPIGSKSRSQNVAGSKTSGGILAQ